MTYVNNNGKKEKVKGSTLYWYAFLFRLKNNPTGSTRMSIIKERIKKAMQREFGDELVQ